MKKGLLIFEYAVMNTGKSTKLLQENYNYKNSMGITTLLIKPDMDTRSSKITSRLGIEANCINVHNERNLKDIFLDSKPTAGAILVDEAQFLTKKQVLELRAIADEYNINVICYGLKTDFMGDLFEGSAALLARADSLNENRASCHCGSKATMALKIDSNGVVIRNGNSVDCGAEDKYVSVCHSCWSQGKTNSK